MDVWGQGKSSVMRLLRADLKKNGVSPIWFNGWHYQKEDHLLAYLLEAIRSRLCLNYTRCKGCLPGAPAGPPCYP